MASSYRSTRESERSQYPGDWVGRFGTAERLEKVAQADTLRFDWLPAK